MNTELLTRIKTWLEAGAPHREAPDGFSFNMARWLNIEGTPDNWCGTSCCIAGAAVAFHGFKLPLWEQNYLRDVGRNSVSDVVDDDGNEILIRDQAQALLGLTYEQAESLFVPRHKPLEAITPAEAAQAITHLIETGEVQWPTN